MTRHRWLAPFVVLSLVVAACGGQQASSPPASGAPGESTEPAASPSESGEQTITYVIDSDLSGGLTNAADNVPTFEAAQFLYDAIY